MAIRSDHSLFHRTLKNSFSGTIAGIAVCFVGHPFDTLKVRLQTQPIHNPVYRGVTDCFLKTLRWEGIGGLYKGVGSPIVGQMFLRATMFTSYYQFAALLSGNHRMGQRLDWYEYFIAGAFTGFVSAHVEGPIDLFKTKMQIQIIRSKSGKDIQYRNVFYAGWIITRTHGIRGAFQGLHATIFRNTPACSIYFGVWEMMRERFKPQGKTVHDLPVWTMFLCGGTAGFLYWFCTYPTDVLKSSMQSDDSDRRKRTYKGYVDCARHLYKNEGGWRRFYRGFVPCLMRSVPANAVMLYVLELCRRWWPN